MHTEHHHTCRELDDILRKGRIGIALSAHGRYASHRKNVAIASSTATRMFRVAFATALSV
eukprot:1993018-Prymnesium_polylepis.1